MSQLAVANASVSQTPPPVSRLRAHKWTVAEFNRLGDMGWFEGKRAFLLDGVILEQGPMDPPHAIALELLLDALRKVFATGWRIRAQMPLAVDAFNDPLPDAAVVRGTPRDSTTHPTTADLVVEVSDSTLQLDLTTKAERYATAGVPEYWVLDVNARVLHVLRDPRTLAESLEATAYQSHIQLTATDTIAPLALPNTNIRVADLLP
jgi:Uma2 family endonuclease